MYGLKSSGDAFRELLAEHLYDLGYKQSKEDPYVWMREAVKPNAFIYYEYTLCYVDDVLCISDDPEQTMNGIRSHFTLKGDSINAPEDYLGSQLSIMDNEYGFQCWAMSSGKYCGKVIESVETMLARKGMRLVSRCTSPLASGYPPEMDTSP